MCTCGECTISQQNRVVRTSACGCLNWAVSISFVRTFQEVTSELLGRPARIFKKSERIYIRYFGRHSALLLIIIGVVTSKQTQSLVWSQSGLYGTVSYGSCMVATSGWYSTVSYGRAVQMSECRR